MAPCAPTKASEEASVLLHAGLGCPLGTGWANFETGRNLTFAMGDRRRSAAYTVGLPQRPARVLLVLTSSRAVASLIISRKVTDSRIWLLLARRELARGRRDGDMRMQRVVHTSKEDASNELERLSHFLRQKRGHRAVFQFKTLEQAAGSYRTVLSGVQQRDAWAVTPLDRCPSTFLRKVCHPTQRGSRIF